MTQFAFYRNTGLGPQNNKLIDPNNINTYLNNKLAYAVSGPSTINKTFLPDDTFKTRQQTFVVVVQGASGRALRNWDYMKMSDPEHITGVENTYVFYYFIRDIQILPNANNTYPPNDIPKQNDEVLVQITIEPDYWITYGRLARITNANIYKTTAKSLIEAKTAPPLHSEILPDVITVFRRRTPRKAYASRGASFSDVCKFYFTVMYNTTYGQVVCCAKTPHTRDEIILDRNNQCYIERGSMLGISEFNMGAWIFNPKAEAAAAWYIPEYWFTAARSPITGKTVNSNEYALDFISGGVVHQYAFSTSSFLDEDIATRLSTFYEIGTTAHCIKISNSNVADFATITVIINESLPLKITLQCGTEIIDITEDFEVACWSNPGATFQSARVANLALSSLSGVLQTAGSIAAKNPTGAVLGAANLTGTVLNEVDKSSQLASSGGSGGFWLTCGENGEQVNCGIQLYAYQCANTPLIKDNIQKRGPVFSPRIENNVDLFQNGLIQNVVYFKMRECDICNVPAAAAEYIKAKLLQGIEIQL